MMPERASTGKRRARYLATAAIWVCVFLFSLTLQCQQDSSARRKLVDRSATPYPALARAMALAGVVKIDVLVAADGSAKSFEIRGGHPVLAQAAVNSVRRWRWEASSHESHELVEVKYSPE